jgi:hypothetical protein
MVPQATFLVSGEFLNFTDGCSHEAAALKLSQLCCCREAPIIRLPQLLLNNVNRLMRLPQFDSIRLLLRQLQENVVTLHGIILFCTSLSKTVSSSGLEGLRIYNCKSITLVYHYTELQPTMNTLLGLKPLSYQIY